MFNTVIQPPKEFSVCFGRSTWCILSFQTQLSTMVHTSDKEGREEEEQNSNKNLLVKRCLSLVFNNRIPDHVKMENYDINSQDENGYSPLHVAVRNGRLDCACVLLKAGADVNVRRVDGYSILHSASAEGYSDLVISLIQKGAVVNAKTIDGETPLHSAVCKSNPDCARILIKYGASVNATFRQIGMTALHIAASKSPNCIDVLLDANANVFAMNKCDICPLEFAMENGINCFRKFCPDKSNLCSNDGVTALHIAARCINAECLGMFIQSGYDVNVTTKNGDTPLHYASHLGKILNCENIKNQMEFSVVRNIELLLQAGACINKKNNAGFTPLLLSIKHNHITSAKHFLNRGADVNVKGGEKHQTALHVASQTGNLSCIKLILEKGADKLAVDADNNTALMLAAKEAHFECVKLLLQNDVPFWPVD